MKFLNISKAIIIALGGVAISSAALASSSDADVESSLSRVSPDALSGSGHSVRQECGGGLEGYDDASGIIKIMQSSGTTKVKIKLKNARPDTHYTAWIRLKGTSHGLTFGGSPITGGGATPLAAGTELDSLADDWLAGAVGNDDGGANSFFTNSNGKAKATFDLDFPLVGGAYPFNELTHEKHLEIMAAKGTAFVPAPTAIVDPRDDRVAGPFLIRVVSHCQDGHSHGLSPAHRETWFNFP